ncbi:MAG: ATP-dependent zinc metalloprotease FtsH [Planctomycetota bacterium]
MQTPDRQDETPGGFDWRRHRGIIIWLVLAILMVFLIAMREQVASGRVEELGYTQFEKALAEGRVETIVVETSTYEIRGEYRDEGRPLSDDAPTRFRTKGDKELLTDLKRSANEHGATLKMEAPSPVVQALLAFIPWVLLFLIIYFLFFRQLRGMGGGGVLSFGKSRATRITRDKIKRTFADVAGVNEAKEEVYEIIEFLRNPERFRALGGRLPRGCLLIGSPGTGKTLLAKAIAGEADVPFYSISGSDFVEMFVGVGASRVRDLFEQAKENAPCIIFLDEIDAVGRKRGTGFSGGHDEREQTLNAILVEMDGFATDQNVIVMAATNRPDVLDPALLRPGRFDRRIYVDLPDQRGREEILKVHGRDVSLAEGIDLQRIARGTPGFSGADLENTINEAALLAAMKNKKAVFMEDLEEARDKVRWGKEKRSRVMTEEDRKTTAWHEAGHAIANALLENVSPLHKVTIIARGPALGATMQLPEKDEYNIGRKRVFSDINLLLAGRAAEDLFCDDITSGAANDLQRATDLIRSAVCEWGMSEALGLVHYGDGHGKKGAGWPDAGGDEPVSEATAERIDAEIRRVMDGCYEETKTLLQAHANELRAVAEALMELEVLDAEEVKEILNGATVETLRERRQQAKDAAEAADAEAETPTKAAEHEPVRHTPPGEAPPLPSGA